MDITRRLGKAQYVCCQWWSHAAYEREEIKKDAHDSETALIIRFTQDNKVSTRQATYSGYVTSVCQTEKMRSRDRLLTRTLCPVAAPPRFSGRVCNDKRIRDQNTSLLLWQTNKKMFGGNK
jgi:hypothetical protein